jgi:hypothetical protein
MSPQPEPEESAGQAATRSDTEPVAPSAGDLGAAPSADTDEITAATQNIKAAEEKLKHQSAEL